MGERVERTELVTFEFGKKGFEYKGQTVTEIAPKSQAEKKGVCTGWCISKIDGVNAPNTSQAITDVLSQKKGRQPTEILFTIGTLANAIHDGVLLWALLNTLDNEFGIKIPHKKPVTSKQKLNNLKKIIAYIKKKKKKKKKTHIKKKKKKKKKKK